MAAVLAAGEGAVLSHAFAGALWGITNSGIRPRPGSPSSKPGPIDVTVPPARHPRVAGLRIHRRRLECGHPGSTRCDVARREGIPVTSVVRTLLDLATVLDAPRLAAAVNEADKLDRMDPEALRAAVGERDGQRGVGALRALLDETVFVLTDSELERRFLPIARRAGLPKPETGVRLHGFTVDFLWWDLGLVVETDGLRYHRTATQQAADRRRDQAMTEHGLTPLRFTHAQVVHRPAEVERVLRTVSARLRGPHDSR